MTANCGQIGALVMRVQNDFLDTPELTLTVHEAQSRFTVDEIGCEAVLNALAEAKVLAKTERGAYYRFFPRLVARASRPPLVQTPPRPGRTRSLATHAA